MATATEKKSAEVAVRTPTPEELQLAYAAIKGDETISAGADPEVVSRAIIDRIMDADTFDEAFQPQELAAWRDFLDVPVTVKGFHLNPSGYEHGSTVYAVVDLRRMDDGESLTVTCGGRNVLAQLVKMLEKGWLDKPVKMIGKRTTEGYDALWLTAA